MLRAGISPTLQGLKKSRSRDAPTPSAQKQSCEKHVYQIYTLRPKVTQILGLILRLVTSRLTEHFRSFQIGSQASLSVCSTVASSKKKIQRRPTPLSPCSLWRLGSIARRVFVKYSFWNFYSKLVICVSDNL
jgi:hypothetical protein